MINTGLHKHVRDIRIAMLNPSSDKSVVDTCASAIPQYMAVLRHEKATSVEIAAALEGIATAMDVGRFGEDETERTASEFYLASAALLSGENASISYAAESMWSEHETRGGELDLLSTALMLALARYVFLSNTPISEYMLRFVKPFMVAQMSEK